MNKVKILSLGLNQSNFIERIYREVLRLSDSFSFYVDSYDYFGETDTLNIEGISKVNLKLIIRRSFFYGFKIVFKYSFWKDAFWERLLGNNSFISYLKFRIKDKSFTKFLKNEGVQIVHFHSIIPSNLKHIHRVPKEVKVILTYWGSDLLRFNDLYHQKVVLNALIRADVITLQNREMVEFFNVKYGRQFQNKIRIMYFPAEKTLINCIKKNINDTSSINHFKNKFLINERDTIITVGHNANRNDNHILILDQFLELDKKSLENMVFLLPFTYGNKHTKIYREEILSKFINSKLRIKFIVDFLTLEELSLLRISTDYFIYIPVSDAMSASVTEGLYAGSELITGCWLPYGKLRRIGINYQEVEKISDLKKITFSIEQKYLIEKKNRNRKKNQNLIDNEFHSERISQDWLNLYTSLRA